MYTFSRVRYNRCVGNRMPVNVTEIEKLILILKNFHYWSRVSKICNRKCNVTNRRREKNTYFPKTRFVVNINGEHLATIARRLNAKRNEFRIVIPNR